MFRQMVSYIGRIWSIRYFWWNLTLADLRFKYRRSYFGVLWSIVQPLAMTLLLSFIMGRFFKMPMHYLAPYIFVGMIVWELLIGAVMTGCTALINAGSYILLFNHPMMIYPLRSSLSVLINFLYALIGLLLWCLIAMPENLNWSYVTLPLATCILFAWCWGGATICAFAGVRFHDLPQFLVIVMQIIWYMSPVFFPLDLFKTAKLSVLLEYNPVYHLLEMFRSPLLLGTFPDWKHCAWSLGTACVLLAIAAITTRLCEKESIYYI